MKIVFNLEAKIRLKSYSAAHPSSLGFSVKKRFLNDLTTVDSFLISHILTGQSLPGRLVLTGKVNFNLRQN